MTLRYTGDGGVSRHTGVQPQIKDPVVVHEGDVVIHEGDVPLTEMAAPSPYCEAHQSTSPTQNIHSLTHSMNVYQASSTKQALPQILGI